MENSELLPLDHPLRSALWIWPEGYMYLHNHFAQFRKDFELKIVPKKAPFFITADKSYKLYVNGHFVCRGPARGYQEHWPFDEVDIGALLKTGRNWISIEAYNPGISTFQYIHSNWAGMLCAARWGTFEIKSDGSWQMRRSPGHRTDTARYSMQIDFQEDVDLQKFDRDWIEKPTPVVGWTGKITPHAQYYNVFPFGRPPWVTVEPRGIPLLKEEVIIPNKVTTFGKGKNGVDYRNRQNISWGFIDEATDIEWKNSDLFVKTSISAENFQIIVPASGKDQFTSVTLDMGKIILANLAIEIQGASGSEIVDFQHHQCLRDGIPQFIPQGEASDVALANRMRLKKGNNFHEFYHLLGFRHLSIIVRDNDKPLKINIKARNAGYPFTMQGNFDCSDSVLKSIYEISRHTQQICSSDAYVDTPWREQAQWWGDARVQGKNTFYLDGDHRLFVRGIRSIAGQSAPRGLTYGHAPTVAHSCILPDFSLTWILTIWDAYWQTGDKSIIVEQKERIKGVLNYFASPEVRDKNGLLKYDHRYWLFEDWADLYKDGTPTFINLWYLYTIIYLHKMYKVCEFRKEATLLLKEINQHKQQIITFLYNPKEQLFFDGIDRKGKPVCRFSVHDQVLAMMIGLVPESYPIMLKKRIIPYLNKEVLDCAVPSAFWSTYLFEQVSLHGFGEKVISFIRDKWTPMLDTGTTWEGFEWNECSGQSCTHAWSAHPIYHFVNIITGIRQSAPAWKEISFEPLMLESLNHADAVIPSPQGLIKAGWKKENNKIHAYLTIPENVSAKVKCNEKSTTVTGKGTFLF